jgi:hypothetical protein
LAAPNLNHVHNLPKGIEKLSIDDDYTRYKQKQDEEAEAAKTVEAERQKLKAEETSQWFETFLQWRFSGKLSGITKDYIYDNSTETRIGPLQVLAISGYTYYLRPIEKGRFAVYTPSLGGKGCDRIGIFSDNFKDEDLFRAIDLYQDRYR